jgi:hypothetical protein
MFMIGGFNPYVLFFIFHLTDLCCSSINFPKPASCERRRYNL